ncbi:MAG: hypothetical protein A2184_04415 [Candidatus Moranbacteria bacterium RIFOXYA1_FULL_44_7]|uniref:Methyltransferase domain-containing protein n=1 Tax=Candidatus Amesbacteria bacterium RIFOXYB1_FULL_44_23 TaxID=1797263 RepID=A0A1F4ZX78_9BACT|nr:MAG: hypothetical protein A2397_01060 [Candidatus Amesbacteria bacterium RIFOXYB1_FULL_44_23]OGI26599.1 MAG: hypothetical protein A2184_04415 [Candidatus Moranbacteria bacterium RIFOXYA1_FULL_44_7]
MGVDEQPTGLPRILAKEQEFRVTFDPTREWKRIKEAVAAEMAEAGEGTNFDKRVKREHQHMDELAQTLVGSRAVESYGEMHARLRAVDRTEWGMQETQRLNGELYEGFDIGEVIDPRVVTELIGMENYYHSVMAYWRDSGHIDKKWVPIDTVDAVCVSSGLAALAMNEGIPLGKKAVDLGGGDGSWGFALAQLGFDVTLIERDGNLVGQFEVEKNRLNGLGINTGNIKPIIGEFSVDDSKNTSEIKAALRAADVMVSYPWPEEVKDRMKLFQEYGREGALLVMYGSGLDSFAVDSRMITKFGLEVVGKEMNEELKSSSDKQEWVRGFNTPSFGANWVVLRKVAAK